MRSPAVAAAAAAAKEVLQAGEEECMQQEEHSKAARWNRRGVQIAQQAKASALLVVAPIDLPGAGHVGLLPFKCRNSRGGEHTVVAWVEWLVTVSTYGQEAIVPRLYAFQSLVGEVVRVERGALPPNSFVVRVQPRQMQGRCQKLLLFQPSVDAGASRDSKALQCPYVHLCTTGEAEGQRRGTKRPFYNSEYYCHAVEIHSPVPLRAADGSAGFALLRRTKTQSDRVLHAVAVTELPSSRTDVHAYMLEMPDTNVFRRALGFAAPLGAAAAAPAAPAVASRGAALAAPPAAPSGGAPSPLDAAASSDVMRMAMQAAALAAAHVMATCYAVPHQGAAKRGRVGPLPPQPGGIQMPVPVHPLAAAAAAAAAAASLPAPEAGAPQPFLPALSWWPAFAGPTALTLDRPPLAAAAAAADAAPAAVAGPVARPAVADAASWGPAASDSSTSAMMQ